MSETESNNSLSTADTLVSGSEMTGQLSSETDIDYFSIAATAAGSVSISFDPTVNSSYTEYYTVSLLDSSGTVLASQDVGKDTSFSAGVGSSGTYYVAVDAYETGVYYGSTYHDSGEYDLTVNFAAGSTANVETESNNSLSTADTLVSGSEMTGQLSSETDIDYFSIAATAAGSVSISFDPTVNSSYTEYYTVSLLDSSGTVLASQDVGKDTSFSAGVGSSGTYYVAVDAYETGVYYGSTYHDSGEYDLTVNFAAGSTANVETESNNSLSTADTLVSGSEMTGQLSSETDIDYFSIAATAAGSVSISFDPTVNSSYTEYYTVSLLDSSGTVLASQDVGKDTSFSAGVGSSGTYYVAVDAYETGVYYGSTYHDSGEYDLTVNFAAGSTANVETESNNSLSTADTLVSGSEMTGQLSSETDIDYFSIAATAAGSVSISFDPTVNSSYTEYYTVSLLDSSGTVLASQDVGKDTSFSAGVGSSGTYYVAVDAYETGVYYGSTYHDSGEYDLTVNFAAGSTANVETESNNSLSTADTLVSGSEMTGQLSSETDIDYFSIAATAAGSVSISFDPTVNSSYTEYYTVSLLDSSGTVLASQDVGKDTSFSAGVGSSGTYYVAVDAYETGVYYGSTYHDSGEYDLTVNFAAGSTANVETESNNSLSTADTLVSGSEMTGQLSSETDIDYFSIAATAAGSVSISFDPTVNSSYTEYYTVSLLDSSGTVLASQDVGKDTSFSAGVGSSGTYYVAVDAYETGVYYGSTYHDSGEYDLTVNFAAGSTANVETESNNSLSTADTLVSGSEMTGQLSSETDIDYFSIAATAAGSVSISFDPTVNSSYTEYYTVSLLDSSGTVLASQDVGKDTSFSAGVGSSGTYYVAVDAYETGVYYGSTYHDSGEYDLTVNFAAGSTANVETESNNSLSTADTLVSGSEMTGQLSSETDIDYFSIAATAAGSVSISFDPTVNSSYTEYYTVSLLDSSGTVLASQDVGKDTSFSAGVGSSGTYYVAVDAYETGVYYGSTYHDSGEYDLTVNFAAGSTANVETESNNSLSTADTLVSGSEMTGQLSSETDIDYFSIAATAAGSVSISFDPTVNSSYTEYYTVSLLDSSGTVLASQDVGKDTSFSAGVGSSGTYYVAVDAYETGVYYGSTYHDSGEYDLTVNFAAGSTANVETESNNSLSTADTLVSGSEMTGQLSSETDIDYFSIAATAAGSVSISFDPTVNSSYTEYYTVSLLDSSGTVLASQDVGKDTSFSAGVGSSGTYYVAVDAYQSTWSTYHDSGEYSLVVSTNGQIGSGLSEVETNDSFVSANPILPGAELTGSLETIGDKDFFYFTNGTKQQINLLFDPGVVQNSSSHVLEIYQGTSLLASRSASSEKEFSVISDPNEIIYAVVKSGDLYSPEDYELTITTSDQTKSFETEPNDQLTSADDISATIPITGNLNFSDDIDNYSIEVDTIGKLTVDFKLNGVSSLSTHKISILDDIGTVLSVRHAAASTAVETEITKAGNYIIQVSKSGTTFSDSDYEILASYEAIADIPEGAVTGTQGDDILIGTTAGDKFVISGGFDVIDGKSETDSLHLTTKKSSVSLNSNGYGYQLNFDKPGYELSGFATNIYNIENLYFSDELIDLNNIEIDLAVGKEAIQTASKLNKSSVYDPLGISFIVDEFDNDTDILSYFVEKSEVKISTIDQITEIRSINTSGSSQIQTLYVSGVETLALLDQEFALESSSQNFIVPETTSININENNQNVVLMDSSSAITSNADGTTLYIFDQSENFEIIQIGTKHFLNEVNAAGNTIRAVDISGIAEVKFSDSTSIVETEYTIDIRGIPNSIKEGDSFDVQIFLTGEPNTNVELTISDNANFGYSTGSFEFTSSNWSEPQTVTITSLQDDNKINEINGISFGLKSDDSNYSNKNFTKIINIIDDDNYGSISGTIYNDTNRDTSFAANEYGIAGWTVYLDQNNNGKLDASETLTLTNSLGGYSFNDLDTGTYTIRADAPRGWVNTFNLANQSPAFLSLKGNSADFSISGFPYDPGSLAEGLGASTGIGIIKSDTVFSNFNGKGQTIVIIDDGIQSSHPNFSGRVVYEFDFSDNDGIAFNKYMTHGTHVAGIAAGATTGIASEANIVMLKVFSDYGNDDGSSIEKALQWVINNCDTYNIASVNLSLGFQDNNIIANRGFLNDKFIALQSNGVFVCAASGNSFHEYLFPGIAYPAADPNVFSVGSTLISDIGAWGEHTTTDTDQISYYSQRNETVLDVFAPGTEIYSSVHASDLDNDGSTESYTPNSYAWMPGTSMAAPQVAGFAAVAQQAALEYLGRKLSVNELSKIITDNADTIYDGDDEDDPINDGYHTEAYYKRVNFEKSLKAIEAMSGDYGIVASVGTDNVSQINIGFSPVSGFNGTSSDDDIAGTSAADILRLLDGNDIVTAGAGDDDIYLGDGNDVALGGSGDDIIYGGAGDDAIDGGAGDDIIYPGRGEDTLTGGDGADQFIIYLGDGQNSILDFSAEDSYSFMTSDDKVLSSEELNESKNSVGEIVIEASDGTTLTLTNSTQTTNSLPNGSLVVSGLRIVGRALQADASSITDADGLGSFSYQWFRDNVEISGATSSEYMLASADVAASIYAVVSYTDGAGNLETISSSLTDKIQPTDDDEATTESLGAISALNIGSGTNISLDFYVDSSIISEDVTSFDMVVSFDSNEADYVSADLGDFLGFPNASGDTITLSGISLSGASRSDPLFRLNFTDLDISEDLTVSISDVVVNGTSLEGSTLLIGATDAVDVATTVISRSGASLSDVALSFNEGSDITTVNTNESGLSTASISSGSDLTVTGSLDYAQSSKSVTSQDALDALRLSVGMDTQSGTSTAFDYIAADFNQDGKVSSQDALAILKYAVGLTTTEQAEWVFVDSDGDYANISRTNTNYDEGVTITDLVSVTELSLTGILIGDVNDSYSGLIL